LITHSLQMKRRNFYYPSTQPGGGGAALRSQLSYLKDFIYHFDFAHMRPDGTVIIGGLLGEGPMYYQNREGNMRCICMAALRLISS
jgi:hypothetical protein